MDWKILKLIQELRRIEPGFGKDTGFVVIRSAWLDNCLDFCRIKSLDPPEGRIEAKVAWLYQNNTWVRRSSDEITFWVRSFDVAAKAYRVSYFHPEDCRTEAEVLGYCLDCPVELAIAEIGKRDKLKKYKEKLASKGIKSLLAASP